MSNISKKNAVKRAVLLERENSRLRTGIKSVLTENAHLADGEICTLRELKRLVPEWETGCTRGVIDRQEERMRKQAEYSIALQRAIERHCAGELVPEEIAKLCPHHAQKLNALQAELAKEKHLRALHDDLRERESRADEVTDYMLVERVVFAEIQRKAQADGFGSLSVTSGSASDVADANGSVYARLKWWKDRSDDDTDEIERLRTALADIIKQQPCTLNGDCFYPMHDGEGNYIGENNVDPLSVVGGMVATAQDALSFPAITGDDPRGRPLDS